MKIKAAVLGILTIMFVSTAFAAEGPTPKGVPHLDHVFLVMMENHGYDQIYGNPNAPFINHLAETANLATNYFAIAHPSLTNYLEVVGGSNFGVLSDNSPDWHANCPTNLATGVANTDNPPSGRVCPIEGTGTDAETVAQDATNEGTSLAPENNIDGTKSIDAADDISGKTIADQLVEWGKGGQHSWKSYQENLPLEGADNLNYSDGVYTNNTDFSSINTPLVTLQQGDIVQLYAVKHNPFAYFRSVQEGTDPRNSLANTVGFVGPDGLYADLASGDVPAFSFIAPNQCNDQHGRGNAGPFCSYDPVYPPVGGKLESTNPALIHAGDVAMQQIVTAIKSSPAWEEGNNAIVLLWDENDYSPDPLTNQVVLIVDTNYGSHEVQSDNYYNHFSLLKSLEAGFGLPCLNHACDADVSVMSDLFGGHRNHSGGHGNH